MPAYTSALGEVDCPTACGAALLPLRTTKRGPARRSPEGETDIIDETLHYYRANVLFSNYPVKGPADLTMVYMTLFVGLCMRTLERIPTASAAQSKMFELSKRSFLIPGEPGWPLGTMYPAPASRTEAEAFKAYFKQAREEMCERVLTKLYVEDGSKPNKWWKMFSKRKFMGVELRDT